MRSWWRHEQQSSAWPWALQHITVRSSAPLHGDRRQAPGPVRVRSTRRTTLHGARTHLIRGSGQVSCRSLGRRGVTAPCGTPHGNLLHWRCRLWQQRRPRSSAPLRSAGSLNALSTSSGGPKTRRDCGVCRSARSAGGRRAEAGREGCVVGVVEEEEEKEEEEEAAENLLLSAVALFALGDLVIT